MQHAHDVSDGGLAVCLAESVIHSRQPSGLGLEVELPSPNGRLDAALFGEAQSRIVLSVQPDDVTHFKATLADHETVQAHRLGTVTERGVRLSVGGTPVLDTTRDALAAPYEEAIPATVA